MPQVCCYKKVFDQPFIDEIEACVLGQAACRTNYTAWSEVIVRSSAAILVFDLPNELQTKIIKRASELCNLIDGYQEVYAMYYKMLPGAYIPWHNDGNWRFGMTIYLNEDWDKNFGGYFAFNDGNTISCIKPEYNCATYISAPLDHCVFQTAPDAKPRKTIQIFGK
jgi:hypothetical protein